MNTCHHETGRTAETPPSFRGIYFIGLAATAIGIVVIILLNLATPLEYMHGWFSGVNQIKVQDLPRQLRGILNLAFLLLLSCPLLLLLMRHFLSPLSEYFNLLKAGRESKELLESAGRRLINLPFIMIPLRTNLLNSAARESHWAWMPVGSMRRTPKLICPKGRSFF
jgi:hypothetical protein